MSVRAASWWRERVRAAEHQPRLAGALLDRRYLAYALHRLRGFAIARGAAAALYVIEASVLLRALPARAAITALVAAHAAALANGFWWGATEVQRAAIRADPDAADRITATWLRWAIRFAVCVIGAAVVAAVGVRERPIAAAYAFVLGMRVAADLPLRVWHARISARRRIFRAMWLQVAIEAIGPTCVLVLHGRLGAAGFVVAMTASAIASRVFAWSYLRAAYRAQRLAWLAPARTVQPLPWLRVAGCGVAGIATRVPNLVGVAFLVMPGLPEIVAIGLNLAVGPLGAAGGWAWSHYVDFVGIAAPVYAHARRRLARLVLGEAIVVGALAGAAAFGVVALVAPRSLEIVEPGVVFLIPPKFPSPVAYAFALPALAFGIALLAAGQLIAWTRGAFVEVACAGAVAAIGLRAAGPVIHSVLADEPSATSTCVLHGAMAILLGATGLVLLLARRSPRREPRISWDVARARAAAPLEAPVVIRLERAAGLVAPFEAALARSGASWWSRRDRSWIVAGLAPAAQRALAASCAGAIRSIMPYKCPELGSPGVESALAFRFDRALPRRRELSEHDLDRIWCALRGRLDGARPQRDASVYAVELDREAVSAFAARLRPATTAERARSAPASTSAATG